MKKKFYSLILTDSLIQSNKKETLLSFSSHPFLNKKKKIEIVAFPNFKKKNIYKHYNICEKLFSNLLKDLSFELNKLHNENYSIKFWDIVLGEWLRRFVQTTYKCFYEVNYAFKYYKIKKIYALDFKKFDPTVKDTKSGLLALSNTTWQSYLYSKILTYKNYKKIVYKKPKYFFFNPADIKVNKTKIVLNKIVISIIKYLSFKKNYAIITNTYLPYLKEKLLEIKFCQIPLHWPVIEIDNKIINKKFRNKIKLQKKNFLLDNFLRDNLIEFIPTFAIENFNKIKQELKENIYPQNPKFIFTSVSQSHDDFFKIYLAIQSEKKTPIIVGQHGNNYFTRINENYLSERNFADIFISWGSKKKPNIKKGFNFKTYYNYKYHKGNKLVIVFDHLRSSSSLLCKSYLQETNHLMDMVDILKNLNLNIKKNTILRLNKTFYKNDYGFKYVDLFKNLDFEIDDGKKNMKILLKDSKLVFYNYDSTGILENFIYNIPSIFFCEKNYLNFINNDYLKKYKLLINNNTLFLKKEKIIDYINKNWDNIDVLWQKKKNQNTIKKFNKNFNVAPTKSSLNYLKSILIKNL